MAGLASEYDVVLVARADGTLAADMRPGAFGSITVIAERAAAAKWAQPAVVPLWPGISMTQLSTSMWTRR